MDFWPFVPKEHYSRSYYEEEEEEEQLTERPTDDIWQEPVWRWSPSTQSSLVDGKLEVDLLVIGVEMGAVYLKSKMNSLGEENVAGGILMAGETRATNVYQPTSKVLIVPVFGNVTAERSYNWTKALFDQVSAKRVIMLTSLPKASYIPLDDSEYEREDPKLHKLQTTAEKSIQDNITFLPPTTILSSLPASILTRAQHLQVPVTCYIVVASTTVPDTVEYIMMFDKVVETLMQRGVLDESHDKELWSGGALKQSLFDKVLHNEARSLKPSSAANMLYL